jgi:sortase A
MTNRNRPRFSVRWLEGGLFLVGLLLVGVWLRDYIEVHSFQSLESKRLEAGVRLEDSISIAASTPAKSTSAPGPAKRSKPSAAAKSVLGRIEIPRLRISGMIAEGTDNRTLKRAVGHVARTSQPGEAGNVGLAAHRDGFFRGLGGVRKDDVIRIVTVRGTYSYRVEWMVVVDPHRVDVLDPTAEPSLTLITCYPFNWIGHAPKRFIVRARQFES